MKRNRSPQEIINTFCRYFNSECIEANNSYYESASSATVLQINASNIISSKIIKLF